MFPKINGYKRDFDETKFVFFDKGDELVETCNKV